MKTPAKTPKSIADLLADQTIVRAELPAKNEFENLDKFEKIMITMVDHNYADMTPKIWNTVYEALGINARSIMMIGDPKNKMNEILSSLADNPKYVGGGMGVGFKDTGLAFLRESDFGEVHPDAEKIGSINLIVREGDKLVGKNTDAVGYTDSLAEKLGALTGKRVALLGAGGTGKGIGIELERRGVAQILIFNRTVEKAIAQADEINQNRGSQIARGLGENELVGKLDDFDVIINVSTKGADGRFVEYTALAPVGEDANSNLEASRKVFEKLREQNPSVLISDINLTKSGKSITLALAEEFGFDTLDGKPMVVNQGVEAFMLVHGSEIERLGKTREDVATIMRKSAFGK